MDMLEEIKILEDEMNKIKEKIDKLKEGCGKDDDVMIKENDTYYYLDSEGEICPSVWNDDVIDRSRLSFGNVIRTEGKAMFKKRKIEIKNILEKYAEPDDYEWDGENNHYYITYDCKKNNIFISTVSFFKTEGTTYFASEDRVWEAINEIGENELIAYLFSKESEEDV